MKREETNLGGPVISPGIRVPCIKKSLDSIAQKRGR